MRSGSVIAVLVAVLAVAAAGATAKPPDTAKIVEHVSAGGVKIGAKRAAVLRAWGKPTRCDVIENSWSLPPGVEHCSWGTPGQLPSQLEVEFLKARVIAIHVRLIPYVEGGFPGWTTTKGIALGATPAAVRRAYGGQLRQVGGDHGSDLDLYLSKQDGETVVETAFTLSQTNGEPQAVSEIAIYDLKTRWICGTVTGPRWATSPGSSPSERGNRYVVRLDDGFKKAQITCTFARTWAAKLVHQRPRKLYPNAGSSNFLAGPTKPKRYICAGETGGRGPREQSRFLKTGPSAITGSCGPVDGQGFSWAPDTAVDHGYNDQ